MKMLWRIYWYILAAGVLLCISIIIFSFISDKLSIPLHFYFYTIIEAIGVVGLYGFVYKEPIFNNKAWLALGLLYFINSILVATGTVSIIGEYENTNFDISGLENLLFYAPQFYALFMYSKNTNTAWQKYST